MYRVPEDFDPSVLVGRTLESVSFGSHSVSFSFDADVQIRVHGAPIAHTSPQGWTDEAMPPFDSSRLMQLAGQTVSDATVVDRSRIRLDFGGGHVVALIDDTPDQYESFEIETATKHWII